MKVQLSLLSHLKFTSSCILIINPTLSSPLRLRAAASHSGAVQLLGGQRGLQPVQTCRLQVPVRLVCHLTQLCLPGTLPFTAAGAVPQPGDH